MSSVGLNDYGGPPEVLHLMKLPYRIQSRDRCMWHLQRFRFLGRHSSCCRVVRDDRAYRQQCPRYIAFATGLDPASQRGCRRSGHHNSNSAPTP